MNILYTFNVHYGYIPDHNPDYNRHPIYGRTDSGLIYPATVGQIMYTRPNYYQMSMRLAL